ncbi:MAG: MBL fold metallo-hydrolase [Deltaproteobacteria bacterium]|nr:MBL fold metallo-hydrolase [Deltaproteobacteria bacterium]
MKVDLIEITQDAPGFNGFLGTWACQDKVNFLIDVGPANTSGRLIKALESIGMKKIDFIFLTHIHIDHFLVDPSKLWAGSLDVLGDTARGYGEPKPVDGERLISHRQFDLSDLKVIETPGHAPHHLSFSYKGSLFAGEAGGNYFLVNNREYLRPATPPRFFFEVFLKSLDRLLALDNQVICYAHFGIARDSHRLLDRFRKQLLRWKKIIHDQMQKGNENLLDRCMDTLLENDPDMAAFGEMSQDVQKREKIFLANSINGFIGFFREKENDQEADPMQLSV